MLKRLGLVVRLLHLNTDVLPLDATNYVCQVRYLMPTTKADRLDQARLSEYALCLVVLSTNGRGDTALDARDLWKSPLREKFPLTHLEFTRFAASGLGKSPS